MSSESSDIIVVVVDPAQDRPLALERAMLTAERVAHNQSASPPKLHIFIAVDYDNTDTSADNPAIHRDSEWFFDQIITPLETSGLDYSLKMSWSSDWYGSIILEAKRVNSEMIMLPLISRPSTHERIFNESIWRLLRTASAPVLIVQPGAQEQRKTILAAVNFQSHVPEYQRLNDLIIERGRWAATNYSADLHFVNAYKDSLNYPDRSQLASTTEVDTAHIHVKAGDPDEVIAQVASEIGADLVLLGTRARSNRWRGNTSERIITKVSCDILTIN
jgi:universal stress protein E